jgi:hypothetical protein
MQNAKVKTYCKTFSDYFSFVIADVIKSCFGLLKYCRYIRASGESCGINSQR